MPNIPVAGLPVGTGAAVSSDTYTVSYLLKNPLVITRRLGEAVEFEYFADQILPNVGTNESGVVIFQEWDPRYTTMDRKAETLAPDAEVPLASGFEGELKIVRAAVDGLGYAVTDDQRRRNMRFVIDRKEMALAHSIADNFNLRAVTAITTAITASNRLYPSTDWSALVTDGATPDTLAEWPHSVLSKINADQRIARVPWRYDAMIAHPTDIWQLSTIYLKDSVGGMTIVGDQPTFQVDQLKVLAMKMGLSLIISDNTATVPYGRPIMFSRGNVGGTAWELPITTEVVPERRRRRDVVQCTGAAAYFVDNPYGLLQLTGTATSLGGT